MARCICGADEVAKTGDIVQLGVTLSMAIEPAERWGRLVAIRKGDVPEIQRYVVRVFKEDDGYFPTSDEYRTTSHLFLCPWMHKHPTQHTAWSAQRAEEDERIARSIRGEELTA